MAEYLIQDTTLTAIADAIRAKTGGAEVILPENMAAEITGIVTGGSNADCVLRYDVIKLISYKSAASPTLTQTVTLPANSILIDCGYSTSSYYSYGVEMTLPLDSIQNPTITTASSGITISCTNSFASIYYAGLYLYIEFIIPGMILTNAEGGNLKVYADNSVTTLVARVHYPSGISELDLSDSRITSIPAYAFYSDKTPKIVLPSTVTTINAVAFGNQNTNLTVDFSRHTSVPSLANKNAFTAQNGLQILVPSALYSKWISTTNWSSLVDYIIAV